MTTAQFRRADQAAIAEAATIIRRGGLVAFPTETVYGIAADATNGDAVARLFATKKRHRINPLIVHVPTLGHAEGLGMFQEPAHRLAERFWPGPLTIVVARRPECPVS